MDRDYHPRGAVDISDLKMESLLQSEAAGVDSGEEGTVVVGVHLGKDQPDLFLGENRGQLFLPLGTQVVEGAPFAPQHFGEEKTQTAVADAHGGGCPVVDIFPVEEVILQFLLPDEIWSLAGMVHQHADGPQVALL